MSTQTSATIGTTATLGHIHLKVRDLPRAVAFYTDLLGWHQTESLPGHYAFLSANTAHHDLALQAVGEYAPVPAPCSVGLYHVAFEVHSLGDLARVWDHLEAERIPFSAVDHGISWALYFADPDGNGVEVYLDRRAAQNGRPEWHGRSGRLSRGMLGES